MGPGNERERFIAGDPLRGLGAFGVLAVHASAAAVVATGYATNLDAVGGRVEAYGSVLGSVLLSGNLGLRIFFVLSGYLIGRPFVRALIDGRPLPSIGAYARNRALRIVPAYWTVLTLLMVIVVGIAGRAELSLGQALSLYALHVPADTPLAWWIAQAWTLEVEAKFYVLVPLAALVGAYALARVTSGRVRALAIAIPCLVGFAIGSFAQSIGDPERYLPHFRLFVAGVALAALEPLVRSRMEGRRSWGSFATVCAACAVLYMLAARGLAAEVGAPFDGHLGAFMLDLAVVGVMAAALLRQWAGAGCWRLLDNPPLRWLGTRSYSFYLLHAAVLTELALQIAKAGYGYKVTLALLLPATLVVTSVAAEILHRAVEQPFLRRKRHPVPAPMPPSPAARAVAAGDAP